MKFVRFVRLVAVAVLVFAAPGAVALTIDEAFAEALQSNPSIEAARDGVRRHREIVVLRGADALPRVDVAADAVASRRRASGFGTRRTTDNVSYESASISVSQSLFSGGRNRASSDESRHLASQSDDERVRIEQEVLLQVATTYFDLLRLRSVVEARRISLEAFQDHAVATRAQFEVRDRTRADVAQADAEYGLAVADLAAAAADVNTLSVRFETLVGVPPETPEYPSPLPSVPGTLEDALALSRHHPAVLAAEHALEAAGSAVQAARARYAPSVDLRGHLTRTWDRFETHPTELAIGMYLAMPLYSGGAIRSEDRAANHLRNQRKDELLHQRRTAAYRTTEAWYALRAARERATALEAAVEASRIALLSVKREAGVGERTVRELLDAERNNLSREISLLAVHRDNGVHTYRLLAAAGMLARRIPGERRLE